MPCTLLSHQNLLSVDVSITPCHVNTLLLPANSANILEHCQTRRPWPQDADGPQGAETRIQVPITRGGIRATRGESGSWGPEEAAVYHGTYEDRLRVEGGSPRVGRNLMKIKGVCEESIMGGKVSVSGGM